VDLQVAGLRLNVFGEHGDIGLIGLIGIYVFKGADIGGQRLLILLKGDALRGGKRIYEPSLVKPTALGKRKVS